MVFSRRGLDGKTLLVAANFSPVELQNYRFGVDESGSYREIFNTEEKMWGGCGAGNTGPIPTENIASHGKKQSIAITLPPLGTVIFELKS